MSETKTKTKKETPESEETEVLAEKLRKPMSVTERREIRSILKAEFEVLKKEVQARADDLMLTARAEIEKQFQREAREAQKAQERIQKKADKFNEELKALEDEYAAKGIGPTDYRGNRTRTGRFHIENKWGPLNLKNAQDTASEEIRLQLRNALNSIDRRQVEYEKQLSLNALVSAEAIEFVESIPSATEMLAMSSQETVTKAIEQAAKRQSY